MRMPHNGLRLYATVAAGAILLAMSGLQAAQAQAPLSDFVGLASDRTAHSIGDSLTVLILESSTASNSTRAETNRRNQARAEVFTDSQSGGSLNLGLRGGFAGSGENGRTGRMVAQISVTVVDVFPNGDLQVAGEQQLQLGRDMTTIRIQGRARRADISPQNTVISSRLADADIAYLGDGLSDRVHGPGPVGRVLGWLGF